MLNVIRHLLFVILLVALKTSVCADSVQKPPLPNPGPSTESGASKTDEANIFLNFDGVSLASVVNYLSEQRKINLIPHKDLENSKVSISTRNPLTFDRAWDVLLTLLEMNGFSMVKVGPTYRIVSNQNNGQEPLPMYSSSTGTEPEDLPDNDGVIRYSYFLKNITTDTAHAILAKMIDEKSLLENKDLKVCVVKDLAANIKSAFKVVKALDLGGLSENIQIIPLTYANADTVQKLFGDILGSKDDSSSIIRFTPTTKEGMQYFSSTTRILSEPIKNALILLGTQKNIEKIKEFVAKYIDVPIDNAESRLHIKDIRYIKASTLKTILDSILKTPKGASSDKSLIIEGGYKAFEDVIIQAESDEGSDATVNKRGGGNRLIVACNREDWKRVEDFIEKIDKPQPQVAIEVMVVDVGKQQNKALGSQVFNFKGKPFAHNVNGEFNNLTRGFTKLLPAGATPSPAISYVPAAADFGSQASTLTLGSESNMWALIQAQFNITNSQVVLQPYVIANNHQKCEVTIDNSMRVSGGLDTKTQNAVSQKIDVKATTSIKLTPHINLVGLVDLDIDVTVNEFVENTSTDQPAKTTRTFTTKSSMATGEVLVLGGLTKSKLTEDFYSTPILGSIPIIGNLFKYKNKSKTESNLYVFMRPSIIKPRFQGAPDEYTQLKLDYAKYQLIKNDLYVHDPDPIQRWFFKPSNHSIKEKLDDASHGVMRPVDNFTYGKNRPRAVTLNEDPFYTGSEARQKNESRHALAKLKSRGKSQKYEEPEINLIEG